MGRVFGLELATCPWCRPRPLRIMAVLTQESVITRILWSLQRASIPPSIAAARARQATGHWVASVHDDTRGLLRHVRAVTVVAYLAACALPAQGTLSVFPNCIQRAVATGGRR